ncbi:uncharacterized protein EI97DRAFT_431011 [Westerdykella ornata]|uniref:Uncharacterized protein n=1 Tax=Westerdykella ornata TaxID=318751 RepID=A0A6A6JQE2_WESOR|nr:uncharacterized protein EI97DRAFT_431011 [Westerdykella ornata]KAF2278762.1 hypothetical protein EI97DRAFT_431011 [Westerdykella ornata]
MPPFHISSTSRALYRVFIAPTLHQSPPSCILSIIRPHLHPRTATLSQPLTVTRSKHYKKKDTERHALTDHYVLDNAIQASHINLVDANGVFHAYMPFDEARRSYNRTTHYLMQVSPGEVDIFGRSDPENPPVCKVVSKIDLRLQHEKKLEIERREARGVGKGPAPKSLELNWAIAPGDLGHRLEKMKQFLREGRKVEVLLGPKRRGRVASEKECSDVLKRVREALAECKGSTEAKEPQGVVGGVMTLVFEGKKLEKAEKTEKNAG